MKRAKRSLWVGFLLALTFLTLAGFAYANGVKTQGGKEKGPSASAKPKEPPRTEKPPEASSTTSAGMKESFSEASGLDVMIDPIEYRGESGDETMRKIPGLKKFPTIHLKKSDLENIDKSTFKEADALRKTASIGPPGVRDMAQAEPVSDAHDSRQS